MNFRINTDYVWSLSLIGGLLAGVPVCLLLGSPMPATNGIERDKEMLKSLIGWGLSRQLTHAALVLSAIVGLFSLLRLKPNMLRRLWTQLSFAGFLGFLSYEYFKLIRSFQVVNQWERLLSNQINVENLFLPDPLQDLFFSTANKLVQVSLMSFAVFVLIWVYAYACNESD
jgi:hypothetical protein